MKTKKEKLAELQKEFKKFKNKSLWTFCSIAVIGVGIHLSIIDFYYDIVGIIYMLLILGLSITVAIMTHNQMIYSIAYRKSNRLDKKIEDAQQNAISDSMQEEIENMSVLRCMYNRHMYYNSTHGFPEPPNYRESMCSL